MHPYLQPFLYLIEDQPLYDRILYQPFLFQLFVSFQLIQATTKFALTSDGTFTPPTDANETQYVVKYQRQVSEGVAIKNKADEFPGTVKLTLKALCVDPCSADTLRACYIVLPSFQVSPEISLELNTEANIEYKGDLQVDYCSADKTLYEIYIAADDEEE